MKILVIQIGRYGDMILTTPLFLALRDAYPESEIHVLASKRNHDVLSGLAIVDAVHVYHKSPVDVYRLIAELRQESFDLLLDPKDHSSKESTLIARLIGAKVSVGFNYGTKENYTYGIPSSDTNDALIPPLHATARNLNVLTALGFVAERYMPMVAVDQAALAKTMRSVPEHPDRPSRIILNISVGQPQREWPVAKWVELGKLLTREGRSVVVLAAPTEHAAAEHIVAQIGTRAAAFLADTIHDSIAMISRGDILVSCDSAPIHIASALDIPVVGIFNSILWNSYKFHPLSTVQRIVQPEISISQIADIPIVTVFQATKEVLQEFRARRTKEG
ncbi:MAG: glycosyltransferase family 9 protein [Candidatus Kapaibacterium sp.]